MKHAEVQLPRVISQQPKSNQIHFEVEHKSDQECYRHQIFNFRVNLYQIVNKSQLVLQEMYISNTTEIAISDLESQEMYISNTTEIAISDLESNSTYRVGISVKSINNTEVFSDPLWIDITTLSKSVTKECVLIYVYIYIRTLLCLNSYYSFYMLHKI